MNNFLRLFSVVLLAALVATGCSKKNNKSDEQSSTTGWKYNDQEWGGFQKADFQGQATGPNLVLIQGGTFTMGLTHEDVTYEWNNFPRRVTVSSFYMDETEVANIDYREYLYWLKKTYVSYPQVWVQALPDTLVWRDELSYNEPLVDTYLRHPSYDDYPVVGVNWNQAKDYAKWRSDRVNEYLLRKNGVLSADNDQKDSNSFNTEAYLAGQYKGKVAQTTEDTSESDSDDKKDKKKATLKKSANYGGGVMLPDYMLPTEAQWEYAALGLQGNMSENGDELISDRRIFPWDGNTARYKKRGKDQGKILANFKRGRGDYMGMAGALNDNAATPAPVRSYLPNDFGLYNMSGNVSEWTEDVYRPLTSHTLKDSENHDLNPFRGNVYKEKVVDPNTGRPVEKDSLGRLKYQSLPDSLISYRDNYKSANAVNYGDDDREGISYGYGNTSLINDKTRVIKGGSWADRLYWLSPGARQYMQEDRASRTVGFRCAMERMGGASGNGIKGGNNFSRKAKRRYK